VLDLAGTHPDREAISHRLWRFAENPDRGPLLIISGERDNTVPRAISEAAYKPQERNTGVTEFVEIPGRGTP
jgi:fermentation-respiration switch protein FrsA (DUF1100 family)